MKDNKNQHTMAVTSNEIIENLKKWFHYHFLIKLHKAQVLSQQQRVKCIDKRVKYCLMESIQNPEICRSVLPSSRSLCSIQRCAMVTDLDLQIQFFKNIVKRKYCCQTKKCVVHHKKCSMRLGINNAIRGNLKKNSL